MAFIGWAHLKHCGRPGHLHASGLLDARTNTPSAISLRQLNWAIKNSSSRDSFQSSIEAQAFERFMPLLSDNTMLKDEEKRAPHQ